jgi:hypothetical protein
VSAGSERLERSRLAILEHVHRKETRRQRAYRDEEPSFKERVHDAKAASGGRAGWIDAFRDALHGWWRYHPANTALQIARPMLASYAHRKPAAYVGAAAVAGAVLLFMRPWKLISVTGIVVALLKSPQVAGMIMSALSTSENPPDDRAPPE